MALLKPPVCQKTMKIRRELAEAHLNWTLMNLLIGRFSKPLSCRGRVDFDEDKLSKVRGYKVTKVEGRRSKVEGAKVEGAKV